MYRYRPGTTVSHPGDGQVRSAVRRERVGRAGQRVRHDAIAFRRVQRQRERRPVAAQLRWRASRRVHSRVGKSDGLR